MYNFIIITGFMIVLFHYVCTMGNQSIFYSYFQSWEWKETWENNDLRRIAGEHNEIIKKGLINNVLTISVLSIILYLLYHYKIMNWYGFSNIIWFDTDKLYGYIINAQVLNVYWYFLLGFGILFWGMIVYFLLYPKYPTYTYKNTPLSADRLILFALRTSSLRDTLIVSIFIGIFLSYIFLNMPVLLKEHLEYKGDPLYLMFIVLIACLVFIYQSKIKWLYSIGIIGVTLWLLWLFVIDINYIDQFVQVVVFILKITIPSAIIGTLLIVVICLCTVIISKIRTKPSQESEYNELSKKMKPWLGFNGRFVSESFIDGKIYDFKELYELTNVKKKWLFWLEYYFSNILNKNVVSLLKNKRLLWLEVLFNTNNIKSSDPSSSKVVWSKKDLGKKKPIKDKLLTRSKAKFEDPEGDVFTNLLIEEVPNTNPSIILPFYVTGLIYLNVIPYFLIYNLVMLLVFTQFIEMMIPMKIALLNELLYGYTGVMILIFLGFLLSIFMNSMSVWLAWKKYYRLQNEGNTDAIFFSIFKQRVIYQYLYEYEKDEEGNIITVNYEEGLYPQFNLAKLNELAKELSPRYYDLYKSKFPFL